MIRWLRDWWDRSGWQPDASVSLAKDRKVEQLRTQAIKSRIAQEAVRVEVKSKVETMRGSFERAEARLGRK